MNQIFSAFCLLDIDIDKRILNVSNRELFSSDPFSFKQLAKEVNEAKTC